MSRLFRPQVSGRKIQSIGLGTAKLAFSFLTILGDGPLKVPALSTVAQLASKVIELAQTVKHNREDCLAVAQQIGDFTDALADSSRENNGDNFDPETLRDLQSDLDDIVRILTELNKLAPWKKIVNTAEVRHELMMVREKFHHNVKKFQVHNILALRRDVAELKLVPARRTYEYEDGFTVFRTTDVRLEDEYRHLKKTFRGLHHATWENRAVLVKQYNRRNRADVIKFHEDCDTLKQILCVWFAVAMDFWTLLKYDPRHKTLPRFLGSSRNTDGKLILVLDNTEGIRNIFATLDSLSKTSGIESFILSARIVHGLSAAIAYIEDQDLFFDLPWQTPFDLRLYGAHEAWAPKVVNVAFGHGCMRRPEVGTPRNTLRYVFDLAMEQLSPTSAFTNAVPIMRLWSSTIRSLLWKRIMPLRDKRRTFLPIYADVRDELADLIDKMSTSSDKLSHHTLDAIRHSVGLFASIFLQCSQGSGPHVGEIVYFKDANDFDISSLMSLDIIPGLCNLMQLSEVRECCDHECEEYERVELEGGIIRHTFRGASRVNLYLGWRSTTINMPVLSKAKLQFPVTEKSHLLYLVSGRRTSLGEAYFYWNVIDPDDASCPKTIHFFTASEPNPGSTLGYWSFDEQAQDLMQTHTPECPEIPEVEWGQDCGSESIEIIEIANEAGEIRVNDGGWSDVQGNVKDELDRFFPLWIS